MKVLSALLTSPFGTTFTIALGIFAMLSIALVDPGDSTSIQKRQLVGALLLLLPVVAQKLQATAR